LGIAVIFVTIVKVICYKAVQLTELVPVGCVSVPFPLAVSPQPTVVRGGPNHKRLAVGTQPAGGNDPCQAM